MVDLTDEELKGIINGAIEELRRVNQELSDDIKQAEKTISDQHIEIRKLYESSEKIQEQNRIYLLLLEKWALMD